VSEVVTTPPAVWWAARLCGLWLIAVGGYVLWSAHREGLAIAIPGLLVLCVFTGLPGLGLLIAPRFALRPTITILSILLGLGLPMALVTRTHDGRSVLAWLAFLVPWMVLVVARYRFLRKPRSQSV
jgi:hypothetical protein